MYRLFWAFTFLYSVSSTSIEDLSHQICSDVNFGDLVANPHDCNSFFVCASVPLRKYCDQGLHFDATTNVCNSPEIAKCKIAESNNGWKKQILMKAPAYTARKQRNAAETTQKPQILFFAAIDVDTNSVIDPMRTYDPHNIVCQHYGAYFLPNPTDCGSYYVCAFGHILQHKCGRGTGWNYKRQLCEMRPLAECYNGATDATDAEAEAHAVSDIQTAGTPPNDGEFTVCYLLSNGIAGPLTWVPQTIENLQLIHTPPTIDSVSSTGRVNTADTQVPTCPKSDEAYLPHATDCSKYYICIIGMPVLTSCPEGLYWDESTESCDWSANVQCQRNAT